MGHTTYRLGTTERIALSASTSAQSAAVGATLTSDLPTDAVAVRIQANVDCFVLVGANPTSSATTGFPLTAGVYEYTDILSGSKIAFFAAEVGYAYVTQTSKR